MALGKKRDLLDDVQQKPSWKARLLGRRRADQARVVSFPPGQHTLLHPNGRQPRYHGNRTRTTKYTLVSFLPKALFEQYRCERVIGPLRV
jgi:hypothetical protein